MPPRKASSARGGSTSLDGIRVSIISGSTTERSTALKDLNTFLSRPERIRSLKDKDVHTLLEALFHCAIAEKPLFFAGKATAANKLGLCGEALREIVIQRASSLKAKTQRAVIDHITEALPGPDQEPIEPLRAHYVKALLALLEQPKNVERLGRKDADGWLVCLDFFLHQLSRALGTFDGESRESRASRAPSTARSQRNGSHKNARHAIEESMDGIRSLVLATNAPLGERYKEVAMAVIQVLQLTTLSVSILHQVVFATINCLLSRFQGDDLALARTLAQEMLPLLSLWWQPHSSRDDQMLNSVRDEILRTIFLLHLHLDALAQNAEDDSTVGEIEDLVDSLWLEYSKRDEKGRLQVTDLDFSSVPIDYFRTRAFALRPFNVAAERKWALVEAIAVLESMCARNAKKSKPQEAPSPSTQDDQPRKRQRRRMDADVNRLHQKMRSTDGGMVVAALQATPFLLEVDSLSPEHCSDILSDLTTLISHKQQTISSWAMIACASLAADPLAKDGAVASSWEQIWRVAVRSVSHQGTSRAASVLLHSILEFDLLTYHQVADGITTVITAADISGPALVVDSSLVLMLHLLHLRNNMLPGASQVTCNHIIRWLFTKWNPADTTYANSHSVHVSPVDIVNLLRACSGAQLFKLPSIVPVYGGPLYQARKGEAEVDDEMMRYLLLSAAPSRRPSAHVPCAQSLQSEASTWLTDAADANAAKKLVLELLLPRLSESLQEAESWTGRSGSGSSGSSEGPPQISTERFQSVVYSAIVGVMMLPELKEMNTTQTREIDSAASNLVERILRVVLIADDIQNFSETCLCSVAAYLPSLNSADLGRFRKENLPLLSLLSRLSETVSEKVSQTQSGAFTDQMDMDDDFESQGNQGAAHSKTAVLPRNDMGLKCSQEVFYLDLRMRLRLLSIFLDNEGQIGLVPQLFVDQLVGLDTEDFLRCRHLMRDLFNSDMTINPDDAQRIFESMGAIIQDPDYFACEIAYGTCIEIVEAFIPIWTNEKLHISEMAGDLYSFLTKKALPDNDLSARAQARLSDLIFCLLEKLPDFASNLGLPSLRSSLLSVFQTAGMRLKFYIGAKLPKLFGLYTFKSHENILADVLDCLPNDTESVEGIAIRLFVFAEVACCWSTTLRRCIYYIFEAAGAVEVPLQHATRCLARISQSLGLESPKELFRLFTPQLLYTWLASNSLEGIPFGIFGFPSLEELASQAKIEAASLMMMRGQEAAVHELAKRLRISTVELLEQSFARVMAYGLGQDVSIPDEGRQSTTESRVRRILGKEPFLECVYLNFVDIVGILFDLIDQEDPIERSFAKNADLEYAASIMSKIKDFGRLDVKLPPNQQPMFKAKFLTREVEHLCSRTEYELSTMWTPPLVVSIARRLLNTIHPALGPLHACSVIRKVRVLLCLAGPQATTSYPLEMILHSIRPYIADPECADDALGITRYLISSGVNHLNQTPSFLAGYALSSLASLRIFLESSQASTTQESQFKATKSKAQEFHAWFTRYLTDYDSPAFKDETQRAAFRSITQSAAYIRTSGNAEKGTHESNLLLEILKDGDREHRLLNDSSTNLALGMLCGDFHVPPPSRTDVIETDEQAIAHGPVVWKSCRAKSLQSEYLTWAGRVIGRSFAASGDIPEELLRESRLSQYSKAASLTSEVSSEQGILYLIQALTTHKDWFTAGLAESALRTVVSEATASRDNGLLMACQSSIHEALLVTSDWDQYRTPPSDYTAPSRSFETRVFGVYQIESPTWSQALAIYMAQSVPDDVVLTVLPPLLLHAKGFADQAFPFIVHLVLLSQLDKQQALRRALSDALKAWLGVESPAARENIKLVINTLLYLRTQSVPNETSIADRSQWLEVNLSTASAAASRCGMFKVALLLAELAFPETSSKASRRSSAARDLDTTDSTEILLDIFENIDDPDAYYGLPQTSSLANVLARLEYEQDGMKSLAFRGAQYDSHLRRRDKLAEKDTQSLVRALSNLGLAGLSHSLLQSHQQGHDGTSANLDSTFNTARRLEIWNLPVPPHHESHAATLYKAYQGTHKATDIVSAQQAVRQSLANTIRYVTGHSLKASNLRHHLGALAALTELDEILGASDFSELEGMLRLFDARSKWMMSGRYGDVAEILSCRESTLGMLSQQSVLRGSKKLSSAEGRLLEIRGMLLAANIYRFHDATQESLNLATSLTDLIKPCEAMGLSVDAAIKMEAANSLWDHGEMIPSIRMLQGVDKDSALSKQTIHVSRADLLAKIGHQASIARLESPDSIQKRYLDPALKELRGNMEGKEAGQVFHQFARFCDEQLQNPDSLSDLNRLKGLEKGKHDEVAQLQGLIRETKESQKKSRYQNYLTKAKQWLTLDQQELRRVEQTRSEFVRLSLENYLLSLIASDEHNNDALRFTALWLERSAEETTNEAVKRHLESVPSRKLAPLMNQLTSRLQDQPGPFQKLLLLLVCRICTDHPFHGMYQIWSGMKARTNKDDEVAVLRNKATNRVAEQLQQNKQVGHVWHAIDRTNKFYHQLASERNEARYKQGARIPLKESQAGQALGTALVKYRIPPPTLQMELRDDLDYSTVPSITRLEPTMSIASGISAPKIITAVGSDGVRYKQLVKGGNDDLRQDAIMEQVFAAASALLKLHRETRRRNLGIRTYKVLPLTAASGLIEFVSDTIPLHDYLMPAHERYHPKDMKAGQCRKEVSNAQGRSVETRVATYRKVAERFQPVMRYFFMEYFPDPDEWFLRRLAYTRTTAAISMLGHVLGLGDRHGHNILLDSRTGEVVHIDLGVAFEMGRVLPVPELVPFRLTRDVVDGMGITRAEGVFRRCCEFTMAALREETYSIMTILDVLRYDPLYSWSISPVRVAKLQDPAARRGGGGGAGAGDLGIADAAAAAATTEEATTGGGGVAAGQEQHQRRKLVNEPSEADRALEVVRKKLSKTLSVTATVNDLINQATSERNLAVLYSGWAAYA